MTLQIRAKNNTKLLYSQSTFSAAALFTSDHQTFAVYLRSGDIALGVSIMTYTSRPCCEILMRLSYYIHPSSIWGQKKINTIMRIEPRTFQFWDSAVTTRLVRKITRNRCTVNQTCLLPLFFCFFFVLRQTNRLFAVYDRSCGLWFGVSLMIYVSALSFLWGHPNISIVHISTAKICFLVGIKPRTFQSWDSAVTARPFIWFYISQRVIICKWSKPTYLLLLDLYGSVFP